MIDIEYVIAGGLTGFVVGLTGVGGGALMTPILLIIFGVLPTTAIATDLWFAAITKLFGLRNYQTRGNVDWYVVKMMWLGSLPMALLIVVLLSQGIQFTKVDVLTKVIGTLVLITAVSLFFAPKIFKYATHWRIAHPERFKAFKPMLTIVSGGLLGLCVALTSVGAGIISSVFLLIIYPLRMTPHRLVATDIAHAIPLAVLIGLGYLSTGLVNWLMLANLLLGSIPTVFLGSLMVHKIPPRLVQLILAVILLMAGVKLLF